MTFHPNLLQFDNFSSYFHGILILYEYSRRGMTLFYTTFIDLHFTVQPNSGFGA